MEAERGKLREAAARDGLTGLFNHRHFRERLRGEIARSLREGTPLSLLIADIDQFKHCNDSYGHLPGDKILVSVARIIKDTIRVSDIPARYGGEEFAVILPNTDTVAAAATAERIREAVGRTPVDIGTAFSVRVTISIGVASLPSHAADDEALIQAADAAMYVAKRSGRNRVSVAKSAMDLGR